MQIYPLIDPFALHFDSDGRYEFVKNGQDVGDDGNWALFIIGDDFHVQVRISGAWKNAHTFNRPK